jgi:membrane protein YqaA with SNARE-associated domain
MRKILAVILGAVVGTTTLLLIGFIANTLQPTPPELMDPATSEAVAQRVAFASTFTWLSTIFGLALGAFLGGVIGAVVAKDKIVRVTSAIGLVLSLWAVYTLYVVFPAVLWVPFGMLISVFLCSYLGGFVVQRSRQKKSDPTKNLTSS